MCHGGVEAGRAMHKGVGGRCVVKGQCRQVAGRQVGMYRQKVQRRHRQAVRQACTGAAAGMWEGKQQVAGWQCGVAMFAVCV